MLTILNVEGSMKTLEIGPKVDSDYQATFVCHIQTYMGDGDDYEDFTIPVAADRVDALENVLAEFNKLGWSDSYQEVPNAYEFFGDYGDNPKGGGRLDRWPYDSDIGDYYCWEKRDYYWYDEAGIKHEAKLVTKKAPKKGS
jgi:hypothetical protein